MQDAVWVRTHELIETYDLHRSHPVNLWPLEDEYLIRLAELGDTLGAILPPPLGWPTARMNPARIVINDKLGDDEQRIVIAHEVGHGVCHHLGNLSAQQLDMQDRHERQAWEVAAMLLIPARVVWEEQEVPRIASACRVPDWLVTLWRSMNV